MMDAGVVGMQLLMPALSSARLTPKFLCLAPAAENSPRQWLALWALRGIALGVSWSKV